LIYEWYRFLKKYIVLLGFPWYRASTNKEASVITSKVLRSPPWVSLPLWNSCVSYDHGYVPLVENISWSFPHSWLITEFVTKSTQRVPLGEQKFRGCVPFGTSEFTPGFMWDSCYSIFGCICMHCISLFVLFRLAILLSVLRFTVYPFGIFKLFLLRCIELYKTTCKYKWAVF
jgi:hypothetical protein